MHRIKFLSKLRQLRFPTSCLALLICLLTVPAWGAENIVLITFDGLRWQEVFGGLDRRLAEHENYSAQSERLMREYWDESAQRRAELLLPFMHGTVFEQGSVVGNRDANSCAEVINGWNFSYPGYSEILTGIINPVINSNSKKPNPEQSFLELLESRDEFRGRTAAFASWDVFPFIFNVERSGIHVNAFAPLEQPQDELEALITDLHEDTPPRWPTVRNDVFTHHYAKAYLQREQPRVLYISYGETDDYAHEGLYDQYIFAARRTDRFISEIWSLLQSMDNYRDNTVLFLAVDHGRGEEPIETWMHHASQRSLQGYMSSLAQYEEGIVGSEAVWMAAMGPGIAEQGLIQTGADCLAPVGIAATLLQLLGEDYRELNPGMAAPLTEFLQ